MTSLRLGDFASARRHLLTAWRDAKRIGAAREVCLCTEFLGELQILTGRIAAARRTLRLCRRLAMRLAPEGDLVAELGIREALLALAEGDPHGAEERAREAIDLCVRKGMAWEEAQARRLAGAALARQGDARTARLEIDCAQKLYERMGERLEIRLAQAWLAWLDQGAIGDPPALHPAQLDDLPDREAPFDAEGGIESAAGGAEAAEESPRAALQRLRAASAEPAQDDSPSGGPAAVIRPRRLRPDPAPTEPVWTELGLVTRSSKMLRLLEELRQLAEAGANILILGETGTGKELLARGIHELSGRGGRFVPFNCAGCPPGLIESELFGVERGAYTGADRRRSGLIRRAARGTLFLDEVGDLRPESQGALLRFLDSGEVRPLGSQQFRSVSLGVVAATLRPLDQSLLDEAFRPDLYYRLAQGFLRIPPLRERLEDLEPLMAALWSRLQGGAAPDWLFEPSMLRVLREHPWRGNIRELRHLMQRLQVRASGREIPPDMLAVLLREGTQWYMSPAPRLDQIREAIAVMDGNRSRAAALLGISRAKLYRLLERESAEESAPEAT